MQSYILDNINKKNYWLFACVLTSYSDTFSLVYHISPKGKMPLCSRIIDKALKKYELRCEDVTDGYNDQDIYRMVLYNSGMGSERIINRLYKIRHWCNSALPKDICFYKKSKYLMKTCTETGEYVLYTDTDREELPYILEDCEITVAKCN